MTVCKQCASCAHKEVCSIKERYSKAYDMAQQLTYKTTATDGRIQHFDITKDKDLSAKIVCKHYVSDY